MSDAYDRYLAHCKGYAMDNKKSIEAAKTGNTPQDVLWAKTVSKHLEDENDEAAFKKVGDEYYFTEKLANRLMHYAWLQGAKGIKEKSYSQGWADAMSRISTLCDEE